MKKAKVFIFATIFIAITVSGILFLNTKNNGMVNEKYDVEVIKWENIYDGKNIQFYYTSSDKPEIKVLNNKYEFERMTNVGKDEIDKTLIIAKWLNVRSKPCISAMDTGKNADDIIMQLETNQVLSQKDYNSVMIEALASIGITSRSGTFKGKENYAILEIWSDNYKKWIAVDGINECYFNKDNTPLSAVELVENNIDDIKISDNDKISNPTKHIKEMSKNFITYTIEIDNSKYEGMKSNSSITFVKDIKDVQLQTPKGYIPPTIFVKSGKVFESNPNEKYKNDNSDTIPTLIFAKKNIKEDSENYTKFSIGAFNNSVMLDKFYLSINNSEYFLIDTYYDVNLKKGINNIKLSIDGKNEVRTVEISKK